MNPLKLTDLEERTIVSVGGLRYRGVMDWRVNADHLPRGRAVDAVTGEYLPLVFFYDTTLHLLGRYQADANGQPVTSLGVPVEIWETRQLRFEPLEPVADEPQL